MALKPYLQLVRLPNVFTAAADSLAGWLLVMASFDGPGRWLPLCLASMAIYAAGIALNDVFDVELDRIERPNRPLPSGRVSVGMAWRMGVGLLGAGILFAAMSGSVASLCVAGILVGCVLAYDLGIRRTWFGPIVMGMCRGLNVLLGTSQAERFGGPMAWLAAGSMMLFVVGLTWISRSETRSGRRAGVIVGGVIEGLAIIGLVVAGAKPRGGVPSLAEPFVLLMVILAVSLADIRAAVRPDPATIQHAVKTGVLSLVWLNVGVVASVRGPGMALAVAALWVPAFVLGKWLYST